jgi:hypothetical protein
VRISACRASGASAALVTLVLAPLLFLQALSAQNPPASAVRPMLLHTAADSGYVYLSWNHVPTAHMYQVAWRRQSTALWQTIDVDSGAYHFAVTDLENDMAYEFRIRAIGIEGTLTHSSTVAVETPTVRDDCRDAVDFACTLDGLKVFFMRSAGGQPFLCDGVQLSEPMPDTRNCAYYSGTRVFGFDRYYGRTFRGADRVPSRALIREAGRRAIWGDEDPFVAPELFKYDIRRLSESNRGLVDADSAVSYIIRLIPEVSSRFTFYWPRAPIPGQYVIYHEGHGLTANTSGAEVINWFLVKGWTVVSMDMPLEGSNAPDARYPFDSHDALRWYRVPPKHALDLFLLPVKVVVDQVMADSPVPRPNIVLAGRSGGGWTACLYGAIDPRITVMINISGCWPRNIALDPAILVDPNPLHFERLQPVAFDQVSMLDFIMASGSRGNFHFYSTNDPSIQLRTNDAYITYLLSIGERENANAATEHRTRVFIGSQKEHGLSADAFDRLGEFMDDLKLSIGSPTSAPQ